MKPLDSFDQYKNIEFIFCDIDDTLTYKGQLPAESYSALWDLYKGGKKIIPVTGRPAGWCEMIARLWPVEAIVGENGGFFFSYKKKKMKRKYFYSQDEIESHRKKLKVIEAEILSQVKGAAIASDQFCRQMDLAIDFCEDVLPLDQKHIYQILDIFKKHGAQAKVSSIHINGWFGDYDKLTMCKKYFKEEQQEELLLCQEKIAFIGDSPNDEPLFESFNNSFSVSNIKKFESELTHKPKYITPSEGAFGFVEFAHQILKK